MPHNPSPKAVTLLYLIACAKVSNSFHIYLTNPLQSHERHLQNLHPSILYLSPEKCERTQRTNTICKLLSKSKKFKKKIDSGVVPIPTILHHRSNNFPIQYANSGLAHPSFGVKWRNKIDMLSWRRRLFHFRNQILSQTSQWTRNFASLPLFVGAIPLIVTMGIILLLKSIHLNNYPVMRPQAQHLKSESEEKVDPAMERDDDERETAEKLAYAIGITAVTAESINLLSYKISFLNTLRTLGGIASPSGSSDTPNSDIGLLPMHDLRLDTVASAAQEPGKYNGTEWLGDLVKSIAEQALTNVEQQLADRSRKGLKYKRIS